SSSRPRPASRGGAGRGSPRRAGRRSSRSRARGRFASLEPRIYGAAAAAPQESDVRRAARAGRLAAGRVRMRGVTPWRWLLALALVVGAALRLIGLGSLPPGLHPDEAADAFEAWTLARTGHASDGRSLPLVFDHHGVDWVEGTYVWLETPFVAAAGGSLEIEVAARLPAALAGIGAVLATFFLARRLGGERLGALAAAIFAVEPWAWHHARFGERAALEPVLVASGLALALRGLDRLDIRGSARAAVLGGSLLGLAAVNYPPA